MRKKQGLGSESWQHKSCLGCCKVVSFATWAELAAAYGAGAGCSAQLSSTDWHLDSGANTLVVDEHDRSIVLVVYANARTSLHTTSGTVIAKRALINTPLGKLTGLVYPGAPRLLPTDHFQEFFKLGREVVYVTSMQGQRIPVRRSPFNTLIIDPAFKDSSLSASSALVSLCDQAA